MSQKQQSLIPKKVPLAERIRPRDLEAFVGQAHMRDRVAALMDSERLPSLLLFGPPGTGKSTLALLLARSTDQPFKRLSAPETGVAALRKELDGVSVLILDELHRFSKAQQDFFLPVLESGKVTLIGTTTENPSFSITRQLLSRLHVLRLGPLSRSELMRLARRGAEAVDLDIGDDSLEILASVSGGDARTLLNLVEYAAQLPEKSLEPEALRAALPEVVQRGDRDGDSHYELASALIKSIRGSDPDAAVYYLACLLESGEDPRFICRRLILSASEDVGLADPQALTLAVSCMQAVEMVGMPEGFIPLAETAVHLALSPKSNASYAAYLSAQKDVKQSGVRPVPLHLRNASTSLQKQWGYGKGYKYPHNFPDAWVDQQYLPEEIASRTFYTPTEHGAEARLNQWRKRHLAKRSKPGDSSK